MSVSRRLEIRNNVLPYDLKKNGWVAAYLVCIIWISIFVDFA